jgi:serine protease DegQ
MKASVRPLLHIRHVLIAGTGINFVVGLAAIASLWMHFPSGGKSVGTLAPVLQRVIPAVVTLRVTGERMIPRQLTPRTVAVESHTLGSPEKEVFRTGGSGVIVDAHAGYVLTNNHVVENATHIDVGLSDGRRMSGKLVGRDIGTDLALLKVNAGSIPSLVIGNSDAARVGDMVVAVGNPFGLEGTATLGIVSALMRTEIGHEAFEDYLQIDAQINPGNSGGALVNMRGELIGINTVVGGGRGKGFSIGFAIPINMAKTIQEELIAHGRVRRGFIGLVVSDLPPERVQDGAETKFGAVVTRVVSNTAAAMAGIRLGDIVVSAANKPVRSAAEYMTRVATVPIGGQIPLIIDTRGARRRVSLKVGSIALEAPKAALPQRLGGIGDLVVSDILPGNPLYGNLRGAQIREIPDLSPSYMAGFEVGDVITAIDGTRVVSVDDLVRRIEHAGMQYRIDIVRDGVLGWTRMNR